MTNLMPVDLLLLISFVVGVFIGHRWATEARRLDDFLNSSNRLDGTGNDFDRSR